MVINTSEKNFEEIIESVLLMGGPDEVTTGTISLKQPPPVYGDSPGGYRKRKSDDYNKSLCLITSDAIDFIYASQPKEWDKLKKHHGTDAKEKFLHRLSQEIKNRGTLDVLRKGIKTNGCKFQLAFFPPATGLNSELQKLYEANMFSVIRQLKYSEKNEKSLDMVLFLNGLPIFTIELKNTLKGQSVQNIAHRIGHKAKVMIVTRSRLHAVRYKLALDSYLKEKSYPYKALVAFSGTVRDSGIEYTEAGMNGFSEKQTAEIFKQIEYRFLIVANKFQTGFDQPLLHTMYVDKKLGGVNAVQTLSRLNRVHSEKQETMVLDFVNEAEDIQKSFQPYYEKTILKEGTDPNLLYDLQTKLEHFNFYDEQDVNRFTTIYFTPGETQDKLHAALNPVIERYKEVPEEEQFNFRSTLNDYIRLYAFLSQIIPFQDTQLEKLYVFSRILLRKLPLTQKKLPLEIQQNIDMESYRIQKDYSGKIKLNTGKGELEPISPGDPLRPAEELLEQLSKIIIELNKRFSTDFSEEDKVFIEQLESRLNEDKALENSVKVNTLDNARLTFDNVANDHIQDMIDSNFTFYKQINDNPDFAEFLFQWLFERYYKRTLKT